MADVNNIEVFFPDAFDVPVPALQMSSIEFFEVPNYELAPANAQVQLGNIELISSLITPPSTPPVISNVIPAQGTAIAPTDPLGFDVTDPEGFRRILLVADFPGIGIREVIHDGFSFSQNYSSSANSRVVIANGFKYTILRTGGWPVSPRIIPYAIDVTGAENI